MRRFFIEVSTVIFGLILLIGDVPSIMAQAAKEEEFTLEEITVTAQKREEDTQKVPIAMEVITGDYIREQGMSNLQEMLRDAVGVTVDTGADGMKVIMRGVSEIKSNPGTFSLETGTPVVAVNVDGVFTDKQNPGTGYYDIERVEVLYGPQSTMYATTSPGGMVNIVTSEPKTGEYDASATLEYGNYHKMRIEGSVNAPLGDKIALRAAFMSSSRDGYMDNGAGEEDSRSGRLKIMYKPNEKFSITLTGERIRNGGKGVTTVEAFEDESETDNPWTSDQSTIWTPSQKTANVYATIKADLGFGTLTVIPAKKDIDIREKSEEEDESGNIYTKDTYKTGMEKGVEARITSSESSFITWIAGANWYKSSYVDGYTATNSYFEDTTIHQNIKAAYGNVTYPINDQLRVTGGIRYSKDENYSDQYSYPALGGVYVVVDPVTQIGHEVVDSSYNNPDYKIGVEYDLGENSMIYSDYTTSYRTQKGADEFNNAFPPEKLKAYTVGSKNQFLENKVQLNASAYYYDYQNYMAMCGYVNSIFREDLNGDGDYDDIGVWDSRRQRYSDEYIVNSRDANGRTYGDAYIAGLDVQTIWLITGRDKINFSFSYLNAKFTDMYVDYWDTTNEMGIEDLDLSGTTMPNSPKIKINTSYSHNFLLPNGGGMITPRIDLNYSSKYFLAINPKQISFDSNWVPYVTDYSQYLTQEAYHILGFSTTYYSSDGQLSFSAYVRNIENYAVKTRAMIGGGGASMSINLPRTYGAVLSLKF